jgi:hypothetical protein
LERHIRRAAILSLSVLAMIVLFPAALARAQYPPPTPGPTSSPTTGAFLECTAEAGPDFLIIECTGDGFAAGSEVVVDIYVVVGSSAAPGINAAPLAGEERYDSFVVTTDDDGDFDAQRQVGVCDLQGMRVEATGENESGDPVSADDTIERALLECAGGTLSTTGADWLRWLTLGLVLVTAGAWVANVRDEREAMATA